MKVVYRKIKERIETINAVYCDNNNSCIDRKLKISEELTGCVDLNLLTAAESIELRELINF